MFWLFRIYWREIRKSNGNVRAQMKYYSRWKKSVEEGASSVKDEQPWITFKTIDYLNGFVNDQSKVFEYGGGGSTLFFTKRAKEVVTVEHNKEWFGILSEMMSKKKIQNWKGNFIEAQFGNYVASPDIANPDHYSSDDLPSKNQHYYNYVTAIDHYENNYFDVVLVDGRSRPACIEHSIPKLKIGGILVLDNSDRDYYLKFFKDILTKDFVTVIDEIGPSPYSKDFTKTSIWKKIK